MSQAQRHDLQRNPSSMRACSKATFEALERTQEASTWRGEDDKVLERRLNTLKLFLFPQKCLNQWEACLLFVELCECVAWMCLFRFLLLNPEHLTEVRNWVSFPFQRLKARIYVKQQPRPCRTLGKTSKELWCCGHPDCAALLWGGIYHNLQAACQILWERSYKLRWSL